MQIQATGGPSDLSVGLYTQDIKQEDLHTHADKSSRHRFCYLKVLEYIQKKKTLKMAFFHWSESCCWSKENIKGKICFLNKDNVLNEILAFFVSICFLG